MQQPTSQVSLDPQRLAHFQRLIKSNPALLQALDFKVSKYCPHVPTPKQLAASILQNCLEGFYGGAAGGGKSDWLLMEALQYVSVPDYAALILRRTYTQLNMPDSILFRAHQWLSNTDARWVAKHNRYEFPSGATLTFGYLQFEKDKYNYDGPAFQFIGFDELTQFLESQYTFLFGRLRRLTGSLVPIRMRSASNPGGVGHIWVKDRFVDYTKGGRFFIPAKLEDNKYVDLQAYEFALAQLDAITRAQRRHGDWNATLEGALFKRHWFTKFIDAIPLGPSVERLRYWDFAASENSGDWTVGTRVSRDRATGLWYVEDVKRAQLSPLGVEQLVLSTAKTDGNATRIRMEQEPGSSGKTVVSNYIRMLAGFDVKGIPSRKAKLLRWSPLASQAEAGNVIVCNGLWNETWFQEMCAVPEVEHDDQADSVSGAFNALAEDPQVDYGISFLGSKR